MTHKFLIIAFSFVLMNCQSQKKAENTEKQPNMIEKAKNIQSIYSFVVKDINGNDFYFATLKGKKIMIVNTASECGLTPQYKELEALYKMTKNLVIIGFPANNFGAQEPGSNAEIAKFCSANYGVSFPMMSKISVKGDDMHPLYQYLTQKSLNGLADSEVTWNFQKYIIDEEGFLIKILPPKIPPMDTQFMKWLDGGDTKDPLPDLNVKR